MKKIIPILTITLTVIVLIGGSIYWQKETTISASIPAKEATKEKVKDETTQQTKENIKKSEEPSSSDQLLSHTKNWPKKAQSIFAEKLQKNEKFTILLVSPLMNDSESDWSQAVVEQMNKTYGETISIQSLHYDMTSLDFYQKDKVNELIQYNPDLVLLESFTYKNDGLVSSQDSIISLERIIGSLESSNENISIILQPSYPLYQATNYPGKVEEVKELAQDLEITYWDNWEAWPDYTSEEFTKYLTDDQKQPNEDGYNLWSNYILEKFIANKE